MRRVVFCVFLFCMSVVWASLCASIAHATIFGKIQGIVHDPQHRPIAGATVVMKSTTSDYSQTTQTDADGQFSFTAVTVGDYSVTVSQQGFDTSAQTVTVTSGSSPILHFQLRLAPVSQTTTVSAPADAASTDSVTPTTLIGRSDIAQTPGADRSNSLQMITDYVPGAYVTHDQLHIRGGHQVSWLIDGVPIPNTNIASNLGPQIDPKDIDYLEVQRGSYDASLGDRTYGEFNVVPRSGFERDNEAELVTTFGNWYQTNDQLNFGGHTQRFAYYASVNANRSNLGLQTPIGQVFHDAENGYGGFGTFLYNLDAKDQFRLVLQLRKDYYQIPFDPNPNSIPTTSGLRDGQHETDGFAAFTWVRTINPNMLLTVSPFYHRNTANYRGDPNDTPQAATDDRTSNYAGAQATFSATVARNNIQVGVYGFAQNDNEFFNLIDNSPSMNPTITDRENPSGGQIAAFIDDRFNVTSWLTLIAGIRPTHFTGAAQADPINKQVVEDTINPRFGVAARIPRINWVFRAFYGHYYQAPPLNSLTGPLLTAIQNGDQVSFSPLHGERDEEHQFGVTIPFRGWTLDADNFQTRANNFFDHNNIGESAIFIPVTIDGALIRGWELTLRSPRIWNRGQFHLAYSNQVAKARGAITGGLICFPPTDPSCQPPAGYTPLDHDQRNTLNVGFNATLPWQSFASTNVYYGSGFTNGMPNTQFPGAYLPQHTTFDLSVGKHFGERFTASVTALNVANRHLLTDNSLTFGGFHYNDPREIYAELRWRFHY
jgi:TonB dependent receptor/Carboxypeptidase regulatory-like domain/TonB-dependent Receptor Plug Domain